MPPLIIENTAFHNSLLTLLRERKFVLSLPQILYAINPARLIEKPILWGVCLYFDCLLVAEKDIRKKLKKSYGKYQSYDLKVWSLEYFDSKTGGYVVVNLGRIAHSEKSKNERKKYKDEFGMAIVFAKNGYRIEMLDENSRRFKYDVRINGVSADMKKIVTSNNIERAASRAKYKQNARIVLFQFDKKTERAYLDLLKLVRKGYKVLYFFAEEGIVHDLRNATPQQMMSGRGGDPSAP